MRIDEIMAAVKETHPGLERMVAFNLIAALAHRAVINVAVAGTGKSACTNTIAEHAKNVRKYEEITKTGLRHIEKDLNGFKGVVIIDDIAKIQTTYCKLATVSTMCGLAYDHFAARTTHMFSFRIENFYGAVLMNVQPVIFRIIVKDDSWEAIVADKSLRYYHFIRPREPREHLPRLDDVQVEPINSGPDVPGGIRTWPEWKALYAIFRCQHSRARAIEHSIAMSRALADLEGKDCVSPDICEKLCEICKPMVVERYLITKMGFESGRDYANELHAILTEFATYGNPVALEDIAVDFRISQRRAYQILAEMKDLVVVKKKQVYALDPLQKLLEVIE